MKIRSEFMKFLLEIPIDDLSRLKESGIGKAVMYLYRFVQKVTLPFESN